MHTHGVVSSAKGRAAQDAQSITHTTAPHAGHVRVCHSRIVSPLMSARVSFALPTPAAAAALQARQQGLVNVGDQVVVNQCPQVRLHQRFHIVYFLSCCEKCSRVSFVLSQDRPCRLECPLLPPRLSCMERTNIDSVPAPKGSAP